MPLDDIQFRLRLLARDSGTKPPGNKHPAREGLRPSLPVGVETVQCVERQPNVRAAPHRSSQELRRCDSDYGEGTLVDGDRASDNRRVGRKTIAPVAIAENGHGRAGPVLAGEKNLPDCGVIPSAEKKLSL